MSSSSEKNKIGVATATIIGMNAMIGAGIFTAPAAMASNVGPAGIIAYILVVIAVWFMAQSLARLAYLFPQEGSFYTYAKQWGGHAIGLIASAAYFVGLLVAMGLLTRIASFFLADFFPSVSLTTLGLITLWGLVALNMFGAVLSEVGQQVLIVCTVFPLLVTTVICFLHADLHNLTPFMPYGIGNVFKATRLVIFGFFGFESAASLFAIVKNPERNVPRALAYSIIAVGIIYTLFIASLIVSTPSSVFAGPGTKVTDILHAILPGHMWLITIINISILSAVIGTVHSMIWGSSALLLVLLKKIKSTNALIKNNVIGHKTALFLIGACICITYITLTNIDLFFYITALFIISAFILSMASLLTIKAEWRSGQNVKTLLGIATGLMIFYFAAEGLWQELFVKKQEQKELIELPRPLE